MASTRPGLSFTFLFWTKTNRRFLNVLHKVGSWALALEQLTCPSVGPSRPLSVRPRASHYRAGPRAHRSESNGIALVLPAAATPRDLPESSRLATQHPLTTRPFAVLSNHRSPLQKSARPPGDIQYQAPPSEILPYQRPSCLGIPPPHYAPPYATPLSKAPPSPGMLSSHRLFLLRNPAPRAGFSQAHAAPHRRGG